MKSAEYKRRKAEVNKLFDEALRLRDQRDPAAKIGAVDAAYDRLNQADHALREATRFSVAASDRAVVEFAGDHASLAIRGETIPNRFQEEVLPLKYVRADELAVALIMKIRHDEWLDGRSDDISTKIDAADIAAVLVIARGTER